MIPPPYAFYKHAGSCLGVREAEEEKSRRGAEELPSFDDHPEAHLPGNLEELRGILARQAPRGCEWRI